MGVTISKATISNEILETSLAAAGQTTEVSESCMGLFKDYEQFSKNSRAFANIYRLTGKDYNDFGKFANCVDNP